MDIKDACLTLAVEVLEDGTSACGEFIQQGAVFHVIGVDTRDNTVCVPLLDTKSDVLWINVDNLKLYVMGSY